MGYLTDEPGDWHLAFHAPIAVDFARVREAIGVSEWPSTGPRNLRGREP